MLNNITIKNLAVVDALDLELDSGLSVLTGETGAGKSILIDALGLVLGDRADASAIRYGADRADIVAEFDINNPRIEQWLSEHELDSEGECVIRRSISTKGRSRGFINGQPIPLQQLKALGEQLVNIHGQNTHQTLLESNEQRLLVDNFAQLSPLCQEVNQHYQQWHTASKTYLKLKKDTLERDAKLDLLRFQVQEFNDFELQDNELKTLEKEHKVLSNANQLIESSQSILFLLDQDENSGISHKLGQCLNQLQDLSELDNTLKPIIELVNNALIQVDESSSELRHYSNALELDPSRLQWLNDRISGLYDLARKHRIESHELYAYSLSMQTELEQLENADEQLENLLAQLEQLKESYFKVAKKLSKARAKATKLMAQQVMSHIHELGMQHCQFEIRLFDLDQDQPQMNGMENIEFYVTTNPGQPLNALAKVVSGGELSRISLAIQIVTAQYSKIATLIFDEVDVGIGGGIAEMVGHKLRELGQHAQILCVTHQAQVASQAHHHLQVSKHSDTDITQTQIHILDKSQRIEELSRMIGGITITEQTRIHAQEMLTSGQE